MSHDCLFSGVMAFLCFMDMQLSIRAKEDLWDILIVCMLHPGVEMGGIK